MNSRMKLVAAVLVACACLVAVLAASLTSSSVPGWRDRNGP
jgi:hypothetical protein